jgi:hypothetical protein
MRPAGQPQQNNDGFPRRVPLRSVEWRAWLPRIIAIGGAFISAMGCEPTVVIGTRVCPMSPTPEVGDSAAPDADAPVPLAWSNGFEDGFCDYTLPLRFCFETGSGTYSLVTSPVHSGRYAAAFSLIAGSDGGSQARCAEQGVFPAAAYYGAWYYIPESAVNTGNWNLLYFQGGVPPPTNQAPTNVWDLSLINQSDGGLRMVVYEPFAGGVADSGAAPAVPIGQWFHLEVYFKRAKDTTGEFSVWQDGVLAVHLTGVETDDTNWGQWYIGNQATALSPAASTVYVDDITMGPTP